MEALIVAAVAFDIALLVLLAWWSAQGGTVRVLIGLLLSTLFGMLVAVPVFAVSTLIFRRRQR